MQRPYDGPIKIDADRVILATEPVLKKITGLETVEGLESVVEVDIPSYNTFLPPSMHPSAI
jgi:hypothetical protein